MVKRQKKGKLDVNARPTVLRVVRVKEKGVVVLQGEDGACIEEQEKNVAPCSLQVEDTQVYPERYFPGSSVMCRECGSREKGESMVLCDQCHEGYHTWCLTPPLDDIPLGAWSCPYH